MDTPLYPLHRWAARWEWEARLDRIVQATIDERQRLWERRRAEQAVEQAEQAAALRRLALARLGERTDIPAETLLKMFEQGIALGRLALGMPKDAPPAEPLQPQPPAVQVTVQQNAAKVIPEAKREEVAQVYQALLALEAAGVQPAIAVAAGSDDDLPA